VSPFALVRRHFINMNINYHVYILFSSYVFARCRRHFIFFSRLARIIHRRHCISPLIDAEADSSPTIPAASRRCFIDFRYAGCRHHYDGRRLRRSPFRLSMPPVSLSMRFSASSPLLLTLRQLRRRYATLMFSPSPLSSATIRFAEPLPL